MKRNACSAIVPDYFFPLAIEKFIDHLSENAFEVGDFSESDEIGRQVYCKVIKDYAITYYPDHAAKEIKVLELVTTP